MRYIIRDRNTERATTAVVKYGGANRRLLCYSTSREKAEALALSIYGIDWRTYYSVEEVSNGWVDGWLKSYIGDPVTDRIFAEWESRVNRWPDNLPAQAMPA